MRKTNIVLVIALVLAMFAGLALNQANGVSAQGESLVGLVVAYTPGQSITILDKAGQQKEYALDPLVKIEPAEKANSLGVGSYVTIIANASISKEKQIAVGIVVHEKAPEGLKELLPTATPLVKNTPLPTDIPVTPTPKVDATATLVETTTATPVGTLASTATPVTKDTSDSTDTKESGQKLQANTFIEWLRSFFQQVLSG